MGKKSKDWNPLDSGHRLPRVFSDQVPEMGREELAFAFDDLARTLALLALNAENSTPFSVVVRGGWGRGKTTLLRRAEHLMETAQPGEGIRQVETLWFNAWKYPSDDMVLAGLLGALLDKLLQGSLLDQLKGYAASYKGSAILGVLKAVAPPALKDLFGAEPSDRYSEIWEKRAFYDTFRRLFNETSRLLFEAAPAWRDTGGLQEEQLWTEEKQSRQTLAIFLDDLDRCRPERVAQVLEAINLFLDLPGVCFFLGVDWRRLAQNLPQAVRDQGDETQYLEKIFQVMLDLPTVTPQDAGAYLWQQIQGTALEWALEQPPDRNPETAIAKAAFAKECAVLAGILSSRHPRHIKRFLNDLSMTLAALGTAGRLGTKLAQVQERAVLAWHLLSEALPEQTWREIRTSEPWARHFLKERRGGASGQKGAEKIDAVQEEALKPYLDYLARLAPRQLHLLIHFAAPPALEVRSLEDLGSSALFRLDGGAWVRLASSESATLGTDDGPANERPAHPVTLSPYWISRYPVTNEDYGAYVREVKKRAPDHWSDGEIPPGKERHPVVQVSWQDAEAYCSWLTRKLKEEGFEGKVALPSEAQWEFAARGPHGREYPWGTGQEPDARRANFDQRKDGDTTPVGAFPQGATPEGIYDLAGNVLEWCRDWYQEPYEAALQLNPTGPDQGASRVVRGGSFDGPANWLRGAARDMLHPGHRYGGLGFRVTFSGQEEAASSDGPQGEESKRP